MGTGLMQWTAAEMVECDAINCGFVFYVCAHHTMEMDAN
jgi:hypothetical protein